jgi:hypothetical protein
MMQTFKSQGKDIAFPKSIAGQSEAIVLEYTHLSSGGNGVRPHGIGVVWLGERNHDPFVVWTIIYDDERNVWFAEQGDYCQTISQAVACYLRRGGN